METAKNRIRSTSTAMIVISLVLIVATITVAIIIQVNMYWSMVDAQYTYTASSFWSYQLAPYLQIMVYAYFVYIFYGIRKAQTPFTKKLPQKLKALALIFFLARFLPELLALMLTVTDPELFMLRVAQVPYMSIAVVFFFSLMVYSLALIFQYGTMLQDDSNEIV